MHYAHRLCAFSILAVFYLLSTGLASPAVAASSTLESADRNKVTWALIWTADFDRLIETAPPEYTLKAIRSFKRNQQFFDTGVLAPSQMQLLFAIADEIIYQVGAKPFSDPRAGVTLIVPGNYIEKVEPTRFGTLLSGSRRGTFALATFAFGGGEATLEELRAALRTTVGGRTAVTRFDNKLKDNRMILVRIHEPLRTYVYAVRTTTGVKGFSMTWSIENTELLHRAVTAAANSFIPSVLEPRPTPRTEGRDPKILDATIEEAGASWAAESLIQALNGFAVDKQLGEPGDQ